MLDQFFSHISFVDIFNFCVFLAFTICYTYQLYYVFVVLTRKPKQLVAKKNHKFAAVISARNESAVIGQLIHSIKVQNYPSELIDVFVIADNCTDNTAEVAREAGAIVFPRFNTEQVGKGYALDYGFNVIRSQYADRGYEAYFVFDADNVLDVNYFREMNKTFDNGAVASTSYRNSKNYDSNWISAGYAVWFLREAKFLNQARLTLNTSCAVSGTGFFVSAKIIERNGAAKPMVCVQCGKCAEVCEHGAITQNAKGVYTINKKLCVGCGKCKDACPFGVLVKVEEAPNASKCIACGICAKACPMEILEVVEK